MFLSARWQHLAMINYQVDPSILQPYLPPYTELDLFEGRALVSMVGFLFTNTKVFGFKWPFHTNFEEVNLRFYVRYFDGQKYRRGAVFISEIVPRRIIATMANLLYNEHYSYMPMKHAIKLTANTISASFKWKKNGWNELQVEAGTKLQNMVEGTEEAFIFEHYWGYSQYNATTTIEYGVEHPSWQVHKVLNWKLNCDIEALYGAAFVPYLSAAPSSAFMAAGSDVVIIKPRFITSSEQLP